ncbi:probable LRR receptor-like serine/threonine-protein kinase At1g05700 isoform X1 [Magnolia sinica]|uniref:probable LRR receptor-like serine/threonine-protein kinase At1g05700 isoform X1 n=1 Tax=Magnolia sinica TaxID=86752 RepID=UPI00265927C7|nr:probable LRR receptor-like serine/threonine-protein kinase At1g05700 isoform X1 [Magnolia sinica]
MANLLPLLLLLVPLIALSESASVFLSINCGASDSFNDSHSIEWVGDERYISTGESRVVQNIDYVLGRTLRVFSTGKKNCYSINEVDKGSKILVLAGFYYGNYDKRSSPPSFDLHFDGNYWDTVTTSMNSSVVYEAIYVTKGDTMSVCVAQTSPDQLPFISILAVRSLDLDMYNNVTPDYALFNIFRLAFGATKFVRYPYDKYDRVWIPVSEFNGYNTVPSVVSSIDTNITNKPPSPVLQAALVSANQSDLILLSIANVQKKVPIYINAYFSEVVRLDSNDKRSMQISINNNTYGEPFIPPYKRALERTILTNLTSDSNTLIALVQTPDSTLPPIINALEFFSVSGVLTNGTNGNDVKALSSLQQQFEKLEEWRGDPCLPTKFNWEWVACSSDPIPRITELHLNGLQLNGSLPDFRALDALQTIDIHNNSINGEIPDFLGTLPKLKLLNLADNNFSGPIPSSISKNNQIKLDVSGNLNLCVSGKKCETSNAGTIESSSGKKKSKLPVILGTTIPSFLVICAIVGFLVVAYQRRKATGFDVIRKPGGPLVAISG